MIPPPRFIVFYNGRDPRPDYEVIKLSDLYILKEEKVSLELTVDVLNINKGHNKELMKACKDLSDYAEYVYRVRKYAEIMSIEAAVDKAIDECIREGILRDFLKKHKAEARAMSIYEYNEEEHMRMEREDAFKDGHEAGREAGIAEGRIQVLTDILADLGPIPDELRGKIQNLDDASLKQWTKLASRAENMEEFLRLLER